MRTNLAASRFYTLGVMPTRSARRRRIGWKSAVEVRGGKGQRPPGVLRGDGEPAAARAASSQDIIFALKNPAGGPWHHPDDER